MTERPLPEGASETAPWICGPIFVGDLDIVASLGPAEQRAIEGIARKIRVVPGQTLFLQDEPHRTVFKVIEGCVRLSRYDSAGRRRVVGFRFPGDHFGFTLNRVYDYSAEAVAPGVVRIASLAAADRLAQRFPLIRRCWNLYADRDLREALGQIAILQEHAPQRLLQFLDALDRVPGLRAPDGFVRLPMPRQDIADYLGLTVETVSREFSRLRQDGALELRTPKLFRLRKEPSQPVTHGAAIT